MLTIHFTILFTDLSDPEDRDQQTPPPSIPTSAPDIESRQQALNYSTLAATAAAVAASNAGGGQGGGGGASGQDPNLSSTETLLRNIQGLLKVAADNARQQERQISYEKGMLVLFFLFFLFLCGIPYQSFCFSPQYLR